MKTKIIGFIIGVVVAGAVGYSGYRLYHNQQELDRKFRLLERKQAEAPSVEKTKLVETLISKTQPWAQMQSRVQNSVAQVFSQIAEFDWLEPYKTPKQYAASGTAFFISEDGELLTNAHVVNQARSVNIQLPILGKHQLKVDIIGVSMDRDIALIKLRPDGLALVRSLLGKIPYFELGDSDLVHRGDEVMALGYPLGQEGLKSTTGVVSGTERHMIQISAAINPGSSGGPTVNVQGGVVGINSSGIVKAQNVGYIIPINEVKLVLDDLHTNKLLRKPYLGVFFNQGTPALTKYLGNPEPGGCYVVDVYNGSPMAQAGVKSGDMIYKINGHPVDIYGQVQVPWDDERLSITDYSTRLKLGSIVDLTLYRKGKKVDLTFKFDHSKLPPIRIMFPGYEKIDYEIIAGMVIMPLTMNHIRRLIQSAPSLIKYDDVKKQAEPALVISHVFPGSYAQSSHALAKGMLLKKVNGKEVATLDDLRTALKKGAHDEFLVVETTDDIVVALPWTEVLHDEEILSLDFHYPMTKLVKQLRKKWGISDERHH